MRATYGDSAGLDEEEIKEAAEAVRKKSKGIILDYPAEFFAEKSADELLALNYTLEQIPYIEGELVKLGLRFKQ